MTGLTPQQIADAQKLIAEKLGGVVDIESEKITFDEAVLIERYFGGQDEIEASFIVSVARGLVPGDSIPL